MDGLITDELFTFNLELDSPELQSVSLIPSSWQLEISKDQSVQLATFDNGEFSLQTTTDCPLLLTNSLPLVESVGEEGSAEKVSTNILQDVPVDEKKTEQDCIDDLVETVVTYRCKLCSFKGADREVLAQHLKSVHLNKAGKGEKGIVDSDSTKKDELEQMAFMCGKCSEIFGAYPDWSSHMSSVHMIKVGPKNIIENFKLNGGPPVQLGKKSKEKKETEDTNKTKPSIVPRKERKIRCPVARCTVRLTCWENAEKHRACHGGPSPNQYLCPSCAVTFQKWRDCATHLWKQHSVDIDLYSCPTCDYKTALRVKLDNHVKIHRDEKEFICYECGKMFKQGSQLANHQVTHLTSLPGATLPNWKKRKECAQCKRTFCDDKALKKHVQSIHAKLRPYVCQVCGHTSAFKERHFIHLRQHTGEKPYSCPACTFTSGDHNSLRRHVWRHSRHRPYSCPHCPYTSIQTMSMKQHISASHPGKAGVLSCPACSFTTLSEPLLQAHLTSKHADGNSENEKTSQLVYFGTVEGEISRAELEQQPQQEVALPLEIVLTDEESNTCFEVIDTGGITIPADQTFLHTL